MGEGFAPRRGAARASWLRVWASPCRGGERTSGIRRRRALWRAKSYEGRACTSRSSTQVVSPRAGTRCVPGLRRTWPARARNAAHRARACCRAWPRAVLMHSARFWFRAARILGDQASCQWPGGMWGVGGACAVETACKCYRHCPADLVLSRALAGKVPGRLGTHRAPATQVVSPRAGVRCVPSLPGTLPARARNAAHRACACCRARMRTLPMHSARCWLRVARILREQASCQRPCGMWGVGGARAVETACKWHPDVAADLVLSRVLAGKVTRSAGTHRAVDYAGSLPEAWARCVPALLVTLPARAGRARQRAHAQ